jgi:hypothetical protein
VCVCVCVAHHVKSPLYSNVMWLSKYTSADFAEYFLCQESKNIRAPDLFTMPLGQACPAPRTSGGVWSPMGVLWLWRTAGHNEDDDGRVGGGGRGRELSGGGGNTRSGVGGGRATPTTPSRRHAQHKALFYDDDAELSLNSQLLNSPPHTLTNADPAERGGAGGGGGRFDRLDSEGGSTGGAGASSVGDLDMYTAQVNVLYSPHVCVCVCVCVCLYTYIYQVNVHYTPHVPMVDIPLAQSLKMRCASRDVFVKICQENSYAAIQAGRTDVAQVFSFFFW